MRASVLGCYYCDLAGPAILSVRHEFFSGGRYSMHELVALL
jgi:hypothetical protein